MARFSISIYYTNNIRPYSVMLTYVDCFPVTYNQFLVGHRFDLYNANTDMSYTKTFQINAVRALTEYYETLSVYVSK